MHASCKSLETHHVPLKARCTARSQASAERRLQCVSGQFRKCIHHLQERAQYLHQFVMHAALDAVDEQLWSTSAMHLGVVDRFNNLQARQMKCLTKVHLLPSRRAVMRTGVFYSWGLPAYSMACKPQPAGCADSWFRCQRM